MGTLFILSAPSGAGKTSLINEVIQSNDYRQLPLERIVTYTTKKPRHTEQDGRDYHFLSVEEFEQKIAQGYFLEWSNAYGAYYGSPNHIFEKLARGISCILILDRTGAREAYKKIPQACLIWIQAELDLLKKRLLIRGTDTPEQIEKRINLARMEIEAEKSEKLFHHYLINNDFNDSILCLKEIIVRESTLHKRLKEKSFESNV